MLIAQAEGELEYMKGQHVQAYMDACDRGRLLSTPLISDVDYCRQSIPNLVWYRLQGFRKSEHADEERERGRMQRAMNRLLQQAKHKHRTVAFLLQHDGYETGVYYGIEGITPDDCGCRMILQSAGNEMQVADIADPLLSGPQARYGGIVLGNSGFSGFDSWDDLMDILQGTHCFLLLLLSPVQEPVIQNLKEYYRMLGREYAGLKSISTVTGRGTQRVMEHPLPQVEELLRLTKIRETNLMRQAEEGMYAVTMYFGAETKNMAVRVGTNLATLMQWQAGRVQEGRHQVCFLDRGITEKWMFGNLWIPSMSLRKSPGGVNDLADYMALSDAAALIVPPQVQRPGYFVRTTETTSFDRNSFDVVQNLRGRGGFSIYLGTISGSGLDYEISLKDLGCHTCIGGKSGNGKTETSHTILAQLYRNSIPALILEPTKKEHWALIRYIPDLQVYSAGNDGLPLRINPMEPEPGISIGAHVNNLVRALESYVDLESPLNEAFQGLFLRAYRFNGWEPADIAGSKSSPYPTFKQAMAQIVEYMEQETAYSRNGEVHGNVRGALLMRLKALTQGTLENVTDCSNGISMKTLLGGPVVIELEDLGDREKIFFMNILMCRLFDYIRQQPTCHDRLKQVIMIEEAHNIFRRGRTGRAGEEILDDYFETLMTTIRASGTGIIVLDQRIGLLNESVLANSKVHINHQVDMKSEIDAVSECMGISEFQKKLIRDFVPGECVAKISGQSTLCRVQVTRVRNLGLPETGFKACCICCPGRGTCIGPEIARMVEDFGEVRGRILASDLESGYLRQGETAFRAKTIAEHYFPQLETKKEWICMAGALLSQYGSGNEKLERKIAAAIREDGFFL